MLLYATLLAACGLFNPSTPVVEVTPVVVAPPAPWQDAYVTGSLVAITPSNFKEVWKTVRYDGQVNTYWSNPNIPLECPADFNLAISYMKELGECFCSYQMSKEQSDNPPAEVDSWEDGASRHNSTYWVDVASSRCVAITEHNGQWWKGTQVPSVHPVNGEDEYLADFYSQPTCTSLEIDGIIDLGDLHDQGSGQ